MRECMLGVGRAGAEGWEEARGGAREGTACGDGCERQKAALLTILVGLWMTCGAQDVGSLNAGPGRCVRR